MKSISEIEEICRKYKIENYTINEDGSIDVDGDVDLGVKKLNRIPLEFNYVSGSFYCSYNKLTSLEFGPKEVGGGFYCSYNKLTSLEFSPKKVGGDFYCINNKLLTNLYGISDYIGGILFCKYETPIGSIIYKPVDMDFVRAFNVYKVIKDDKVQLKRLKYVMETFGMWYDLNKIKKYYEIN